MPVVHSKPRTPQTNNLIEQDNGELKSKILAWMAEIESTEWWLALPEAMLSINRQVHSTTGRSQYEILFKQLMPDRPRISTAQWSTAVVSEKYHDIPGLPLATTGLDTIPDSCIDPQLLGPMCDQRESLLPEQSVTSSLQAAAVPEVIRDNSVPSPLENSSQHVPEAQMAAAIQTLNQEMIEITQRKVIAMEKRYNKVNNVEVFEEGDCVRLKIPVGNRCTADNKRIFCRVVKVKHGNRYALHCQYGILQGFYQTKIWTGFVLPFPIKFQHIIREAIESLLSGKLHGFSHLLSSSKYIVDAKGIALPLAAHVSKRKLMLLG